MKRLLTVILAGGMLVSCNPCKDAKCAASDRHFSLEIRSDSTNQDLFFGPNAVYDPDSLTARMLDDPYYLLHIDTTAQHLTVNAEENLSCVLEYPGVFKDTIYIGATISKIECCDVTYCYTSISYDGEQLQPTTSTSKHYIVRK